MRRSRCVGGRRTQSLASHSTRSHSHHQPLKICCPSTLPPKLNPALRLFSQGVKSLMERLMVALEEVPPDTFRASLLKGLPAEKRSSTHSAHPPGGRASPARRSGQTPPDRKARNGGAPTGPSPTQLEPA